MIVFFWQENPKFFSYSRRLGKLWYWGIQFGWLGMMLANAEMGKLYGTSIRVAHAFYHTPSRKDNFLAAFKETLEKQVSDEN